MLGGKRNFKVFFFFYLSYMEISIYPFSKDNLLNNNIDNNNEGNSA